MREYTFMFHWIALLSVVLVGSMGQAAGDPFSDFRLAWSRDTGG